ncbi:LLM class flavin-dependent oxidoreductase [Alteromonas gilva]|uniref:LLM class flavin-dependent oxidoreductase n=1 Tax=Alteromonas gilva TaxID=2987522 RepID=A0ABT5L1X0_9ALTE|nr:LLM class flavin-dependent oxidoreductase [Alteromonas gilva]MDC8830391.1 LLM class flavin-dependent oxidoreductase [Alteromonas gilva]
MTDSITLSILDLAHVASGTSVRDALLRSQANAICAEQAGFKRYWLAEHHGMRAVASAATAVLLASVGAVTSHIRIGAGGIMLPNHAPLVIAEQFGTLAELYPGRVELGLGRAPGTDLATAKALRRNIQADAERYPQDITELQQFFAEPTDNQQVIAVPGAGTQVPIWLLGSSLYSAQLAAHMGLPFSFASHFAPDMLQDAISIYRANFRPSEQLSKPYVSAGVMAVVGDTSAHAEQLFSSVQQQFANLRRGANNPLPSPVEDIRLVLNEMEIRTINSTLRYAAVGDTTQVQQHLNNFAQAFDLDELILSFPIYDHDTCLTAIKQTGAMHIYA